LIGEFRFIRLAQHGKRTVRIQGSIDFISGGREAGNGLPTQDDFFVARDALEIDGSAGARSAACAGCGRAFRSRAALGQHRGNQGGKLGDFRGQRRFALRPNLGAVHFFSLVDLDQSAFDGNGGSSLGDGADDNKIEPQPRADIDDVVQLIVLLKVVQVQKRLQVFAVEDGNGGVSAQIADQRVGDAGSQPRRFNVGRPEVKDGQLDFLCVEESCFRKEHQQE